MFDDYISSETYSQVSAAVDYRYLDLGSGPNSRLRQFDRESFFIHRFQQSRSQLPVHGGCPSQDTLYQILRAIRKSHPWI